MEESLFIKWVQKYFPSITLRVVETLNDTKNPVTYLHRRMLRKEFSVTGKWESISITNSLVMADVVAMDSSLPLKKRDALSKATGDIPKMGMELKLNERQLTDLDTLVASSTALNPTGNQVVAKLFQDTPKVIGGIFERNEAMFLEGLSTGITLVEDADNVGTGIRLDYGYKSANKFGVAVLWSNTASTPMTDLQTVVDKAVLDGNSITKIMMDKTAFNNMAKTTQVKEQYAFFIGFVGTNIQVPSLSQMNAFISDKLGVTLEIVDRAVRYEKNGTQTVVKPWATGAVVLLTADQIGALTWARLAEQNHPVTGVTYSTVDDFILVSKYRKNQPSLSEYTSSQARVVPVIGNVDQIYLLDSTTVQA